MSEVLSSPGASHEEGLVRQILAFQRTLTPELKRRGEGPLKHRTYAGIASYALKDLRGEGEIKVGSNLMTEEELKSNATIWVRIGEGVEYKIDVRDGALTDVYDQDGQRVEDGATLKKLRVRILQKHLVYRALNLKNSLMGWYNNPNDTASNQ